mgnify:FL=1
MPIQLGIRSNGAPVRGPVRVRLLLSEDNLFSGQEEPVDLSRGAVLADARLHDIALAGYEEDAPWTLIEDPCGLSMRVSHRQLVPLFAKEDVYFVFWGEGPLGYFCPEPWLGGPDALNTGRHVAWLAPGSRFGWEMKVEPLR